MHVRVSQVLSSHVPAARTVLVPCRVTKTLDLAIFFSVPAEDTRKIACLNSQGCRLLQQLIQGLNSQLTHYTSFKHYESELSGHITPLLDDRFEELDETSAAMLQVSYCMSGACLRRLS